MGLLTNKVKESGEELGKSWGGSFRDWLGTVWGVFLRSTLGILLPPPVLEKLFPQTTEAAEVVRDLLLGFIGSLAAALSSGQPQGRLFSYEQDQNLRSFRLDPLSIITAWRRDPVSYSQLFDDLRDQGWSEDRIEALKYFTLFWPTPQDLVTWSAREVFEPDAREKYGLDDEFGKLDLSLFAGAGVSEDQALNYWRAHWQHPSFMQMRELLIRGLLTPSGEVPSEPATPEEWATRDQEGIDEIYEWYRLVEIPPHWRAMLTESLFNIPTRVDVRRFRDMRVISKEELYSIYHRQGYHGKDLDYYVTWTDVYNEFPSLLARWSNGWITEEDVRAKLLELGMPAERVEEMIQEKIKPQESARVEEGRTFTKSEIYKGVKQGVITRDEGVELIMDLGYNRSEAEYLLDINVEVLSGSPDNFAAFKDLTTKYKKAVGREAVTMPEELKQAGERVVKLESDVKLLQAAVKELEDQIIPDGEIPEQIRGDLDERRAELARAELELAGARSSYETELARWRHGGG